jgi:hypothetical protein
MSLENERSRGEMARQVIENPLFQEAFIAKKAKIMSDFEATKFRDQDVRDELWRKMQTLRDIEHYFTSILSTGKMANQEISRLQKMKNKLKIA